MAGDFDANMRVRSSTVASSSATGTTVFTKPIRSASAAPTRRPVSISSSAFFGGIERMSGTVIIIGHRPTSISGVPNSASSAAMTKSHIERDTKAAGEREAADPRDRRLAELPHVSEQAGQLAPRFVEVGEPRAFRHAGEIGTRRERPVSRSRDHDDTNIGVGLGHGNCRPKLAHHRPREGVAAIGPVDRDRGDMLVDVVEERLEGWFHEGDVILRHAQR